MVSCKKKAIKELPTENSPVFIAKGTFMNETFEINAGDNGNIMNTYTENINGIKKFTGKIGNSDFNIEMGMYNGNNDFITINESIIFPTSMLGAFNINTPLIKLDKERFYNSNEIENINWYIDNEFKGEDFVNIYQPGNYKVKAQVTFFNGEIKEIVNNILVGYDKNVNFSINHLYMNNENIKFWLNDVNGTILNITWKNNGIIVSNQESFYLHPSENDNFITAEVLFTNGILKKWNFYCNKNNPNLFISDFSFFEKLPYNKLKWDYKFLVIINKNNQTYRSDFYANKDFTITPSNISYYGKNDTDNSVYKIDALVSCDVQNISTEEIEHIEFNTKFGIEIK